MKSLKMLISLVFAAALLMGCSPKTTFVDQSWTVQPKLVKVVFTEPEVESLDDLQDDLPEYVDNFGEWFSAEFVNKMNEYTKDGIVYKMAATKSVGGEVVTLNNESFKAPKAEEMDADADVYLVLDKVWFGRESESGTAYVAGGGAGGMGMGMVATSSNYFRAKCKYSFYDVKAHKIVGYGKSVGSSSYTFGVDKGDWETAVRGLASNIIDGTPMYKY